MGERSLPYSQLTGGIEREAHQDEDARHPRGCLCRCRHGPSAQRCLGLGAGRSGHDPSRRQTYTDGGQCTANFIFTGGGNTYIGQSAHCAGTGAATDTNGCDAGSLPLGTPVEITGASKPGTLAYSSWIAMQQRGETNAGRLRVQRLRARADRPGRRGQGQPLGARLRRAGGRGRSQREPRRRVLLRQLLAARRDHAAQPQAGQGRGQTVGNGWSRTVYTVTPGIPGDSGSGFLNGAGGAIGTLSTVAIAPARRLQRRGRSRPRAQLRRRQRHGRVAGERHPAVHARHGRRDPRGGLRAARRARAGTVRARHGLLPNSHPARRRHRPRDHGGRVRAAGQRSATSSSTSSRLAARRSTLTARP